MSEKQLKPSVLEYEVSCIKKYMRYKKDFPLYSSNRQKNSHDSIKYRQRGNALYKMKNHNERIHEQIWRTYTQSIALAPNKSEELACGYGNRSALLFHLERFKDCIEDCDKALSITKSDALKSKLLTRKAECLFLLDEPEAEDIAKEAMQALEKLHLGDEAVKSYDQKLNNILSDCSTLKGKEEKHSEAQNKLREKYINQMSDFSRSKEAPYASKSVAIRYNEEFGRHLVATEYMRPGDIFAIEKNYYTYISRGGMYLYCSNCAKYAWSSIPCENCIFDVYCSESCRSEAWNKYHQWECTVYPLIWDIDADVESPLFIMRFALSALNEVGGIDNMKKLLMEMDNCNDPRTKGFTNGIFDITSVRAVYSSLYNEPEYSPETHKNIAEYCINAYLIAKHTTFFGLKMDLSVAEIFKNQDVLFFAALLLHSCRAITYYANHQCSARKEYTSLYATTVRPFTSLINHSCDPNIELFTTKRNTTVAYALKPIKKGTQLLSSYGMNFLNCPKIVRQEYLKNVFKFTCKCLPCTENWPSVCLSRSQTMKSITPELRKTFTRIITSQISTMKKAKSLEDIVYSRKLMQDIAFFLESMANDYSPHCEMYQTCLVCLYKMFCDVFESFSSAIPEKCFIG